MKKFSIARPFVVALAVAALMASLLMPASPALARKPSAMEKKQAEVGRRLAEAFLAEGQYRKALLELEKAQALDDTAAELYFDFGTVYLCLSQAEKAVDSFKQALAINPNFAVAKNSLGAALMTVGRYDEAIPILEELSENLIYTTPQFPLLNLAYIYYVKGQYDKAESYYKRALEAAPKFAQAWRGLGRTYAAAGRISDALDAYRKAVEYAPNFAMAFLELGDLQETAGQAEDAVVSWKSALTLAPDGEIGADAKKRLAKYAVP